MGGRSPRLAWCPSPFTTRFKSSRSARVTQRSLSAARRKGARRIMTATSEPAFERVCRDELRDDGHDGTRLDRGADRLVRRMFEHDVEILRTDTEIRHGPPPSLESEDCGAVSVEGESTATVWLRIYVSLFTGLDSFSRNKPEHSPRAAIDRKRCRRPAPQNVGWLAGQPLQ
jgi:hypothetical protein